MHNQPDTTNGRPPGVAVVVGASRGIGYAIAHQLSDAGHVVVAGCRSSTSADLLSAHIGHTGGYGVQLDVADPPSIRRAGDIVAARHGVINTLIFCAGVTYSEEYPPSQSKGPLEDLTSEAMIEVLKINAVGAALTAQELIPLLSNSPTPGVAMFLTSQRGSLTLTDGPSSISYAMSKAALNMLVKKISLSPSFADSIIFGVHPGWVATDLGGPDAPIPVDEAATQIIELTLNATDRIHGRYVDTEGQIMPW